MAAVISQTLPLADTSAIAGGDKQPDPACVHRWRATQSSQQGFVNCEHCAGQIPAWQALDMLLVETQNRLGIT